MQNDLFGSMEPQILDLPQLDYGPIRTPIGQISCVLRAARKSEVTSLGSVQVSARTVEPLFELSDGERVVVTSRKNIARPHDVDALLLRTETELRWLSHRLVDELESAAVTNSWPTTIAARARAWDGQFSFRNEVPDDKGNVAEDKRGLRPPQVGALHAIGAHWSLYKQPATIVMPTGTGKTETMLSALAAYAREPD